MLPEIVDTVREVQLPLLAVLLLLGAIAKAVSGSAAGGTAVLLPRRLLRPVTAAAAAAEGVLAVGLLALAGPLGDLARAGTAVLFALAFIVLVLARRRDPEAGCGCFGGLSRAPIGWRALTRAVLLSGAALATFGLAPAGWEVLASFGGAHAVVLGVGLAVLAVLSPEPRELVARWTTREPCALRPVPLHRTMLRLRASDVWRTNRDVLRGGGPEDVWRHGCWRFLRYDGTRHGRRVDVVFAVRIGGSARTAVRAVLVDRASGQVCATFGAVTTRRLQGPPRKLPRPREAARRDEALRDAEREARALRIARAHPAARPPAEEGTGSGHPV
ncbi:MauE/DoxX family redox-associated membrane protein [Nocardiopsis sp. CNT312]|uniref:MauE/DoxX family redox-associated membrane protein n=1 Tax=Nocardiopsis sp. CNT312 TaxID=1137268 RepID=UPI00048FD8ED|nr:MauE/DoxX family redox-associated membrane protein [Nocardiopsis sp. CNT312]